MPVYDRQANEIIQALIDRGYLLVTQYTDEMAQDAVGGIVDGTLIYVDGTPVLKRAPITGHILIPDGSNTASLGSFTSAQLRGALSNPVGTGSAVFASSPQLTGTIFFEQLPPVSFAAAGTIAAADLLGQLLRYTGAGAAALTTCTGTQLDTAVSALTTLALNTAFNFSLINAGGGAVTLTAGTDISFVGSTTIAVGVSSLWRARKTATTTWAISRIA